MGMLFGWAFVALLVFVPINWIRLWATGDVPPGATVTQLIVGTLICWGLAAGVGYLVVLACRRAKARKAQEQRELQALMTQALAEVPPAKALLKSDEKAYATAGADLQEEKTVGYTPGTKGVSVRVAKGLTLRSSGTRGKAAKGTVAVAKGELVVTDKRVIFAGDNKSFAIALSDLLNVTDYIDGFGLSTERTTYKVRTHDRHARTKFEVVLQRVLQA